jgi:hypothetical protein
VRRLILAAVRYEWRRLTSQRRFFFWALIGIPFVLPIGLGLVTLLLALSVLGPPPAARVAGQPAVVLIDEWSPPLGPALAGAGVGTRPPRIGTAAPDSLDAELRDGRAAAVLYARRDASGEQALRLRVASPQAAVPTRLREQIDAALAAYQTDRLASALSPLALGPAERAALTARPRLAIESTAPSTDPTRLLLVAVAWSALIVLPYMQLARSSAAAVVSDRLSGVLLGVAGGLLSARGWVLARWLVLARLALILVLYYAGLIALMLWGYAALADRLVEGGILEQFGSAQRESVRFALVDLVAALRALTVSDVLPVLALGIVQAATLAALLLLGSTLAGSVAGSRLLELVPFALAFLLPFLALSGIASATLGPPALVTGLNSLVAMASLWRDGVAAAAPTLLVVLLANAAWLALALEWASRRAGSEAFLAPASA